MTFNPFLNRPAPDRRAVGLEDRIVAEQPVSGNSTRTTQDPTSSQGRTKSHFNQSGFLVLGRIVDAVAYTRTYKVQCERGLGTLRCCDTAQTSLGVVGPRQLNTYTPGTGVLVFYNPQAFHHPILCAIPDWMVSATDATSDYIGQGSNCGLQVDAAHNFPFTLNNHGIIDFSAGRPVDSLHAGEYGAINELGMRIFMDSMQMQIAVDEATGLYLCYLDQYARLSGYNLDIRSAGSNREDRDDEGEFSSVEEYSPYLWETLGMIDPAGAPFRELTGGECQQETPNRSRLEPQDDRQLGIYRETHYHGYLGQGGKTQISAPADVPDPEDPPVSPPGINTYDSDGTSIVGLAEENFSLDGGYSLRSSHGVYIAKMPLIPGAKRAERPESQAGDRTDDQYASCGVTGEGAPHLVQSLPTNDNDDPHVIEPAALFDLLAYVFNWKGLHPFHYHAKDWYLSEESEMDAAAVVDIPPFADLATAAFLPQAPTFSLVVDERYGAVQYYANLSCFALLPNGGIAQVDGFGAEQRSAGGTQYHHTPGDLIMTAGRNIILQAGDRVIVKGRDGVEISSSRGSARLEAGQNVYVMGGNEGCGGVLIESRASGPAFSLATSAFGTIRVKDGVVYIVNNEDGATGEPGVSADWTSLGSMNYQGPYDAGDTYSAGDCVGTASLSISLVDSNTGNALGDPAFWAPLPASLLLPGFQGSYDSTVSYALGDYVLDGSDLTGAYYLSLVPNNLGQALTNTGRWLLLTVDPVTIPEWIDSSEDTVGGVVLRAKDSAVAVLAQQVTVSTAIWGDGDAGPIILDAGSLASIITRSSEFHRHLEMCGLDIFSDGSVVNEYWASETRVSSGLIVTGDAFVQGDVSIYSDLAIGHRISALEYHGLSVAQADNLNDTANDIAARNLISDATMSLWQVTWLADHSDLASVEFYFPDTAGYGAENFTICEPLWAQLARLGTGGVPATWTEPVVTGDTHADSMPYPGIERWSQDDAYGQQDLNLFDPVNMYAVDRGADYENAEIAETTFVTLDKHWPVIRP